ncbi:MAG: gamma-glutamylcyclotransferase family protein, partial [Acidimicrobiia bacterium]
MTRRGLFVYGTLRKDIRNSMFHLLAREATFVGGARAQGRLFHLGEYPGLVPSRAPGSWVHGEVYAL